MTKSTQKKPKLKSASQKIAKAKGKRPKKTTEADAILRVMEVYNLLLSGASRGMILRYADEKWGIKASQVNTYIRRACDKIKEEADAHMDGAYEKALSARNRLLATTERLMLVGQAGPRDVLAVLSDRERLQGLYAPEKTKVEHSGAPPSIVDLVEKAKAQDAADRATMTGDQKDGK